MKAKITDILKITYPIIQGPMFWITDAKFVATVSNAGGLGVLGPNAGHRTITDSVEETAERMRAEIRKVRELTDKPFGVNIGLTPDMTFSNALIEVIIEEKVPVAVTAGGLDTKTIKKLKDNGLTVVYRAITPTAADAQAAEKAGADIIVATGFDEGGTLPERPVGTFTIVPLIADAVSVPVMAAGGIGDIRGVRAAFALGADGIYAGSVFIPTVENPASQLAKEEIIKATTDDMITYRAFPAYARFIRNNDRAREIERLEKTDATRQELQSKTGRLRLGFLEGDLVDGGIAVGLGITPIKEIRTVKAVIEDLMQDLIEN